MPRQKVITIQDIAHPLDVQVFSDLKTACSRMGMSWSYETLKKKGFPNLYKGTYWINRITIKRQE